MPVIADFIWQPGDGTGTLDGISWAVEIPWEKFTETVKKLKEAGVRSMTENPEWRQDSYWGFSVMDPMGNTVEVYSTPPVKPEPTEWSE